MTASHRRIYFYLKSKNGATMAQFAKFFGQRFADVCENTYELFSEMEARGLIYFDAGRWFARGNVLK